MEDRLGFLSLIIWVGYRVFVVQVEVGVVLGLYLMGWMFM